jgi:hypothetical protein
LFIIEWLLATTGELAKIAIRHTTGVFYQPHRGDHRAGKRPTAYRKILNRSLGLRSVVRICRDFDRTHGISLGSHFRHRFQGSFGGESNLLNGKAVGAKTDAPPPPIIIKRECKNSEMGQNLHCGWLRMKIPAANASMNHRSGTG